MRLDGRIQKGWGYEIIFSTTEKYCGKYLVFKKAKSKCSMHYHLVKDESWNVNQGSFILRYNRISKPFRKPFQTNRYI